MDLVTIIIPVFNYGFYLPETIDSLQQQTYSHWEALIIDDGSNDDTQAVVKRLSQHDRRIKYHCQPRRGVSAARNRGIDHAEGAYILFLDGDDLITPNKLAEHVSLLKCYDEVDMCYSDVYYFRNDNKSKLFFGRAGNRKWTIKLNGKGFEIISQFVAKNRFTTHCPLIRTQFLKSNKLRFDESICYKEDWDFWLRCVFSGANIHYLASSEVYALVRVHSKSVSQKSINMDIATIRIRESIEQYIHSNTQLSPTQKTYLLKINNLKKRAPLKKMIYYNLNSLANLRKIYQTEPSKEFFICFIKALNEKRKDFF
ncbi:MAG TPA: glycosyltransferase family 2 protein [Parapedobacter sp.]|uniref:glycosyltransferase family 2 protein n=1 Tax=Parapedobacter sp. TaxID=1958893 RepID=UPI002CAD4D03|nr:glycosyltransferase family 2 protein [Parapedobacter sp.]HWK56034.1 glycosyltransferase family 2 protein [Parapedobacter sp.]